MATLLQSTQFPNAPSGTVYAYEAGTSTPKNMFADQSGTILGVSQLLSDNGSVPTTGIWLQGAYKLIVKDSGGSTLYTLDNVEEYDSLDFAGLTASIADLNSTTTTALVKTSTYSVAVGDRGKTILANATSGNVTINLPAAATAGNKFIIRIKKIDVSANVVTIDPAGTQTVDGLTVYQLLNYFDSVILQCDGSNWYIVAAKLRDTVQAISASRELKLANDVRLYLCDASSGAIDLKLPSPAIAGKAWRVGAKKVDSSANIVTLKQNASETIDGQTELGLSGQYEAVEVITDGTNWHIANEYGNVDLEPFLYNSVTGFLVENDSGDTAHDIKVYSGDARSADDNYNIKFRGSMIKRIDASWAEGSNNGGFPTGITLTINTWYHYFAIIRPNGQIDFGWDSNLDANKLLADATNYVAYVRIPTASVLTDASNNITQFTNFINCGKRYTLFGTPIASPQSQAIGVTTAQVIPIRTPTGISVEADLAAHIHTSTSPTIYALISSLFATDVAPQDNPANLLTGEGNNNGGASNIRVYTNTSSQVRFRASATNGFLTIAVIGWSE